MSKTKKRWIVCQNTNGMFYAMQTKAYSIYEFWDRPENTFHNAVYGPCSKSEAKEFVEDAISNNLANIIPDKPELRSYIIGSDDIDGDDDDDYEGRISYPKG